VEQKGEVRLCPCKVTKDFEPVFCPCWEISQLKKDEICTCNIFKRMKE